MIMMIIIMIITIMITERVLKIEIIVIMKVLVTTTIIITVTMISYRRNRMERWESWLGKESGQANALELFFIIKRLKH